MNDTIAKNVTTPQVYCYTTLWNVTEWGKLSQRFIDHSIGQRRRQLERRPAARWTHWTFDVKTAGCDNYFRQ